MGRRLGGADPLLAVFLFLHFPKPGYLLPLAPLAFLALMAGLAPMGRRGTIALAGIAVAGGVQFLALGPLPASVTGGGLRYGDKTPLQRLATDLEPVAFASARTIAGVDSRIEAVRRAVGERCDADGVILVSDGGAIDWRQAMYYVPAHRVVRASLPDEPLMVAYRREVDVNVSLERLQSACPAIWIGEEPAAAALPDFPAPIIEPVSAGLLVGPWTVCGRCGRGAPPLRRARRGGPVGRMAFKAQRTAVSTAVLRALERYVAPDQRLFDDPFARPLCGPLLSTLLSLFAVRPLREWAFRHSERRAPGTVGLLLCRFAYLDDVLRDALADGVRSVVILGAGLDSRAYRVPGAVAARVFEVDHPSVLEVKKTRLQRHLGTLPSHVRFVAVDFETLDLAAALAPSGFDPGTRTLFLWEGVSQYISREALHDTLRFVGRSAPGSRLAFSYVLQRFIDDRSAFPELSVLWDLCVQG